MKSCLQKYQKTFIAHFAIINSFVIAYKQNASNSLIKSKSKFVNYFKLKRKLK